MSDDKRDEAQTEFFAWEKQEDGAVGFYHPLTIWLAAWEARGAADLAHVRAARERGAGNATCDEIERRIGGATKRHDALRTALVVAMNMIMSGANKETILSKLDEILEKLDYFDEQGDKSDG